MLTLLFFWHRNILIASDGNVMFYLQRQNCFCTKSALAGSVLDLILPVQSPSWRCDDAFLVFPFGLMIVVIPVSP